MLFSFSSFITSFFFFFFFLAGRAQQPGLLPLLISFFLLSPAGMDPYNCGRRACPPLTLQLVYWRRNKVKYKKKSVLLRSPPCLQLVYSRKNKAKSIKDTAVNCYEEERRGAYSLFSSLSLSLSSLQLVYSRKSKAKYEKKSMLLWRRRGVCPPNPPSSQTMKSLSVQFKKKPQGTNEKFLFLTFCLLFIILYKIQKTNQSTKHIFLQNLNIFLF